MSIQANYQIVIIGAGPAGITEACIARALNKQAQIYVLDKREQTTRLHGLRIAEDSVMQIVNLMNSSILSNDPLVDRELANDIKNLFTDWKGNIIRTNIIENALAEKANQSGIKVLRGKDYEIKEEMFDCFLQPLDMDKQLTQKEYELHHYLYSADLIIAADGSHSNIRKKVLKDQFVDNLVLRYFIEFKYETSMTTKQRSCADISFRFLTCGKIDFETINKPTDNEGIKPGTIHIDVDLQKYNKLRLLDANEHVIKGDYQTPWTIEEIKTQALTDKVFKEIEVLLLSYRKNIKKRNGWCTNERITTLPVKIYRSEKAITFYKGKPIFFIGDAYSGLVFERGANKALIEAVLCARATIQYFLNPQVNDIHSEDNLPNVLKNYQEQVIELYENEKWWVIKKNQAMTFTEFILTTFIKPVALSFNTATNYLNTNLQSTNSDKND